MKLFGHYVYLPIALLALLEYAMACLALAVAFLAAPALGLASPIGPGILEDALFGAGSFFGMTAVGLYQAKQRLSIEGVVARIVVALGIGGIGIALIEFLGVLDFHGRTVALGFAIDLVLLCTTRAALWRWMDHEAFQRRVLVYGAGERAASLLKLRRRSDRRGFNIVAFVQTPEAKTVMDDERVVALQESLVSYARVHNVDEIVVAMDDRRQGFPLDELLACRFEGLAVVDLLAFLERETGKVMVDLVNPAWLIFSDGFNSHPGLRIATRVFDFVSALVLLIIALPFMLIVAIAITIEDGFPALFRQRRVGMGGKAFWLYKFRSMIKDAEADGAARWATAADKRITRVGAVIRKIRFDELPQLFNVLIGNMSMVGPRPERPEFVQLLVQRIPYYHERHSVKPGITGWAQLCYPYGASDEDALEKLRFDLYYIKYRSLIFDLMVLLQTAEVVLWGKGAR